MPQLESRQVTGAENAFADPAGSVAAFDEAGGPPIAFARRGNARHELDDLGWTELHMIFQRALEEILAVTFEVGERLKQNPQVPRFLASYVLSTFETADPSSAKID